MNTKNKDECAALVLAKCNRYGKTSHCGKGGCERKEQ